MTQEKMLVICNIQAMAKKSKRINFISFESLENKTIEQLREIQDNLIKPYNDVVKG